MPRRAAARAARSRPAVVAGAAARVTAAVLFAAGVVSATATTTPAVAAGADASITLPAPARQIDPLIGIGLTRDRLLHSQAPGPVDDREDVTVGVGPTGVPARVEVVQRLRLTGTGDYAIRERGPARAAVALGDTVPPVLVLGTVVWQGFSPGHRDLAARLTLDAALEAPRLPMAVRLAFTPRAGAAGTLEPGGAAPADGEVTVTLVNQTASARTVTAGTADAAPLAAALDRLLTAGRDPRAGVPPTAGDGLPTSVAGTPSGNASLTAVAPLRVTGHVGVDAGETTVTGPGTTPTAAGATVDGTLADTVTFHVAVTRGQRLSLDLSAQPWIDPRTVTPPAPATTWQAWAARDPDPAARQAATTQLVAGAAAAARAAEYTPYLQADVPGPDVSTFHYVVAPAPAARRAATVLHPRPGAISASVVAVLAVVGNAALLRRRL